MSKLKPKMVPIERFGGTSGIADDLGLAKTADLTGIRALIKSKENLTVIFDFNETLIAHAVIDKKFHIVPRPGAAELLQYCRAQGVNILLWTGSSRQETAEGLVALGFGIGPDDVKPAEIFDFIIYKEPRTAEASIIRPNKTKDIQLLAGDAKIDNIILIDNREDVVQTPATRCRSIVIPDFMPVKSIREGGDRVFIALSRIISDLITALKASDFTDMTVSKFLALQSLSDSSPLVNNYLYPPPTTSATATAATATTGGVSKLLVSLYSRFASDKAPAPPVLEPVGQVCFIRGMQPVSRC